MPNLELPLPPAEIRFMAESDQAFLAEGQDFYELLKAQGFREDSSLLDLGSAYGRLPYGLLRNVDYVGSYLGLDILPKPIKWCREVLSARYPNFRFLLMNVYNERYNPCGLFSAREYLLPCAADSFDYCCLFSVFTHMYEAEIQHYLHEILRVLKPQGKCLATFFLYDDERIALINAPGRFAMPYRLDDHTLYHNAKDKLHGICYRTDHVLALIKAVGFQLIECRYGYWAGGTGVYQDLLVLAKS